MARDGRAAPPTLAARVDRLFATVRPRDGGAFSYAEVADGIRRRGGPTISATYVWQLRRGLRDNPTKKQLEALADFFGVSPAHFFDDEAASRVDAELRRLSALRDASVRQLAVRAFGLSTESLAAIAGVVERVRQLEGLPDPESSAAPTERPRRNGGAGPGC